MPTPDLSKLLITPPAKGDHDGNYRWQWLISFKVWGILAFCAWAAGGFSAFGLDGFARAEDVQSLRQEVRETRLTALESQLFELRLKQCQAEGALRVALSEQLAKLNRDYHELTGTNYQLPSCEDLR